MLFKSIVSVPLFAALAVANLRTDDTHDSNSPYWTEFVAYAVGYKKEYSAFDNNDALVQKRYQAFQVNMDRIQSHNARYDAGDYTFKLGLNEFADLSDDEYKQMQGYKAKSRQSNTGDPICKSEDLYQHLPKNWDWRSRNVVTPVKDQGLCGCCWAFSAVASMESVYAISTGKLVSFSEQELVDCTSNGLDTCKHGGEPHDGFEEIIKHHGGKIDPESVYKYTGKSKGVCNAKDSTAVGHFTSYESITPGCEMDLQKAVATKAVVSVGIDASSHTFQLYQSGVYNWPACKYKNEDLGHAAAVVGYGVYEKKDIWLVKNSWGTTWGMDGYIMMSRNAKNQCGIASDASYPVMTK